jgi:hypothetical protein
MVPSKTSPRAQNMKLGPDALGTAENESRRAKHENGSPTPTVPSKMSPGAQNMETGPDALSTSEHESGRSKYENGTRRPRYRRKRVQELKTWKRDTTPSVPPKMSPGAQNMKKEHDELAPTKSNSGAQI